MPDASSRPAIAPPGQEGWREAPGWWIQNASFDPPRPGAASLLGKAIAVFAPLAALAQDEGGPRDVQLPNPMGAHTWFIIAAVGAFLAWCISYVLEIQKERLRTKPQRGALLRQKEELLDRLAELERQKEAGTIAQPRYEKEFKKVKGRLSEVLSRLGHSQDSTEK